MNIQIYQVDAFANEPFKGNPAAVCILDKKISSEKMQNIASEMNLSETAFLIREKDGYNLRWFTPTVEVDLCGHATLASAFVLYHQNMVGRHREIAFFTRSGLLSAKEGGEWIKLDFPSLASGDEIQSPAILQALGIETGQIFHHEWNWIVEVASPDIVRELKPDFAKLGNICKGGVSVTSRSDRRDFDFISRVFAPSEGINEDPVTGSAYCCLGPYWGRKLNKQVLKAFQASSRGGTLKIKLLDERVALYGKAVLVMKGEIYV